MNSSKRGNAQVASSEGPARTALPRFPRTRAGRTGQNFGWSVRESISLYSAELCFRALTACGLSLTFDVDFSF